MEEEERAERAPTKEKEKATWLETHLMEGKFALHLILQQDVQTQHALVHMFAVAVGASALMLCSSAQCLEGKGKQRG